MIRDKKNDDEIKLVIMNPEKLSEISKRFTELIYKDYVKQGPKEVKKL